MFIVAAVIQILIIGTIFAFLLRVASKIVLKESVEFGDAFKASIIASAVVLFADYGLIAVFTDGAAYTIASITSTFVIWVLALMIVIGLNLVQALLIALIFMILTVVLQYLFMFFLMLGQAAGNAG